MEDELVISEIELEELAKAVGGAATKYIIYTVVKHDTLSKIAKKFGTTWKKIYALNRDIIKDPNKIQIGWKLMIPVEE